MAAVVETARGARDAEVIRRAQEEQRVLLTEDKDFGQLVYAGARGRTGVILLRFPRRPGGRRLRPFSTSSAASPSGCRPPSSCSSPVALEFPRSLSRVGRVAWNQLAETAWLPKDPPNS